MEKLLLTNPEVAPECTVFKYALGKAFPVFEKLCKDLTNQEIGLTHEWRYYNDGKAWLCKVLFKKKTVFWLSIWESCFKITFYLTEKHLDDFLNLPIAPSIKEQINRAKPIGKLIPFVMTIHTMTQLEDVKKIAEFKKNLL